MKPHGIKIIRAADGFYYVDMQPTQNATYKADSRWATFDAALERCRVLGAEVPA